MIAQILEYRCDMGCGATYQTEERWLPDNWLVVEFGQWGKAKTTHHVCSACVPAFKYSLNGGAS